MYGETKIFVLDAYVSINEQDVPVLDWSEWRDGNLRLWFEALRSQCKCSGYC